MQENNTAITKQRVIVYVDGFNLYFGLKTKKWKSFYWLNIQKLAINLLKSNQDLISTKYFTSRIALPPDKAKRQGTFIEALETLENFKIYYGNYQSNSKTCRKCGNIESVPNEKMTDVNIAVEILTDAFEDLYDIAILISGDSDLSAPIQKIKKLFPSKKIILAFPPSRFSFSLSQLSNGHFMIGEKTLAKSLFPDEVTKKDGYVLKKPARWVNI
jgi:uncharacterized LabA/DUF88 family protein